MKPVRIQLRRTKGWRKPDGAVVVSRPTKWGNPFVPAMGGEPSNDAVARIMAVNAFRDALQNGHLDVSVADVKRELRGKSLACWCKLPPSRRYTDVCHARVLMEIANR